MRVRKQQERFFLCLILGFCFLGSSVYSVSQSLSSSRTGQGLPIPDERFYPLVFRHILYLQDMTGEPAGMLVATPSTKGFYNDKVGATDPELTFFVKEARAWKADVDPIDSKAHELISAIRAKTPGGKLAVNQLPPSPPSELLSYQQQRDSVTLMHVKNIRTHFGDDRFAQLDKSIHQSANITNRSPRPSQVKP